MVNIGWLAGTRCRPNVLLLAVSYVCDLLGEKVLRGGGGGGGIVAVLTLCMVLLG